MPAGNCLEVYRAARAKLEDDFLQGVISPIKYLRRHTEQVERGIAEIASEIDLPTSLALVATGGFGRSEMFPYSDIDILVLSDVPVQGAVAEAIENFVTRLWDFGLTVGAAVRSVSEMQSAFREDITVQTSFLESRFLQGDKSLYDNVVCFFRENLDAKSFYRKKWLEMRQRHQKFGDTPFALEPNLKESQGGIRDLQVLSWCAKAAGFGSDWRSMQKAGLMSEAERVRIEVVERFLQDLRLRLQLKAARPEDRLVFDLQQTVALSCETKRYHNLDTVESMMREYYLNAKTVAFLNGIVMDSIAERLFPEHSVRMASKRLDERFCIRADKLDVVDEPTLRSVPGKLLEVFRLLGEHREVKTCSTRLLRALWAGIATMDEAFRNDLNNRALFLSILQARYGTYHALRAMNDLGFLGRFMPFFQPIVGQLQHDLFHIYTVDQHSMQVVNFIRRFSHSTYAHEFPLCSKCMTELPENWRVTLAGLFHDIGKGRGGDHSEVGAALVREHGDWLGLDSVQTDFIAFLVKEHLTMSHVAQKKDISDPDVVQEFAQRIGTKERLDALYILTVADIRATNPKIWNSWKAQLLEQLYTSTVIALETKGGSLDTETLGATRQQLVFAELQKTGLPIASIRGFLKELDLVYFLRNNTDEILWHAESLSEHLDSQEAVVKVRLSDGDNLCVLVYVPDQPYLFARVVSFFELNGLSVLDARIHTTHSDWALDSFVIEDKRGRDDFEALKAHVETGLSESFALKKKLPTLKTGKLSRRSRSFPIAPRVHVELDATQSSGVLQIVSNDRLGLLYAIAMTMARHAVNLESAKITTLDERAEDTFRIEGEVLKDAKRLLDFENDLLLALSDAR